MHQRRAKQNQILARRAALRQYSEEPLRQGVLEPPWQRLVDGLVLGTVGFAEKPRQQAWGTPRNRRCRASTRAANWDQTVAAVELWEAKVSVRVCSSERTNNSH